MKKKFVRAVLRTDNRVTVDGALATAKLPAELGALLQLIGEVLDDIAAGDAAWITIGTNLSRNAFLLTYHYESDRLSAGGDGISSLGADSRRLVEPL